MVNFDTLRVMSTLLDRMRFRGALTTHGGKRDLHTALGYADNITPENMRHRFERGDIAARIVDAYPKSCWRHGAEVLNDETPKIVTPFEQQFNELNNRTKLWNAFYRTDMLAQMGDYACLFIGAPGDNPELELPKVTGKDAQKRIAYFACYGQANAKVSEYVTDIKDPRYNLPLMYELTNLRSASTTAAQTSKGVRVHWSRVIHFADGFLDDPLKGITRLQQVWDKLDELVKIVGGGSEAFWKLVFQGVQFDIDKDMDLDEEQKQEMSDQIDEYEHNLRRYFRTRGVKVNPMGQDVADFSAQATTVLGIIAGTTGIPQRILLGSERGELASSQDKANWDERVADRQTEVCSPYLVQPTVDRLIAYGYLSDPGANGYWVRWPVIERTTQKEKAEVAKLLSEVNTKIGGTVVTPADVRDKVLGWDPLTNEDLDKGFDDPMDIEDEDEDLDPDAEVDPDVTDDEETAE